MGWGGSPLSLLYLRHYQYFYLSRPAVLRIPILIVLMAHLQLPTFRMTYPPTFPAHLNSSSGWFAHSHSAYHISLRRSCCLLSADVKKMSSQWFREERWRQDCCTQECGIVLTGEFTGSPLYYNLLFVTATTVSSAPSGKLDHSK